jgi:hypothetical protein
MILSPQLMTRDHLCNVCLSSGSWSNRQNCHGGLRLDLRPTVTLVPQRGPTVTPPRSVADRGDRAAPRSRRAAASRLP